MANYYLAACLKQAPRDLGIIDPAFARRGTSDGWIGDASHQASVSDHNPDWADGGVVRAVDIDVKRGILAGMGQAVVKAAIEHPSTQYVIYDGYIYNRKYGPFRRRVYKGWNKHESHVHISIMHSRAAERSTARWGVAVQIAVEALKKVAPGERTLRLKDPQMSGTDVTALQAWIGAKGDGWFGPNTEAKLRIVQEKVGAEVDGVAGPETWKHYQAWVAWRAKLEAEAKAKAARKAAEAERKAREAGLPKLGRYTGPAKGLNRRDNNAYHGGTEKVQRNLAILGFYRPLSDEKGRFGDDTEAAVRAFQKARGLKVDGYVGAKTWAELEKVS